MEGGGGFLVRSFDLGMSFSFIGCEFGRILIFVLSLFMLVFEGLVLCFLLVFFRL